VCHTQTTPEYGSTVLRVTWRRTPGTPRVTLLHNMIIELRGDGIADTLPDPYGNDPQRGAGAGTVGERESASSATVPAVDAVERCRGETVLALCKRLRSLQDDSASWSLRELLWRHYWGWNASQ
jgi:hypothetical protein